MARKVFVSSDMAHDEKLIEVAEKNPQAALIWPWFVTYFDDWGRAEAHPKRIKAQLFPMNDLVTPETIEEALHLYEANELIERYEVGGKSYMAVPSEKWWKYQTHIHKSKRKEDKSRYPSPDSARTSETPRDSAESRGIGTKNVPSPSTLPPFHPTPSSSPKPPSSNGGGEDVAKSDDDKTVWNEIRHWFAQAFGGTMNAAHYQEIDAFISDGMSLEAVVEAVRLAALNKAQGWSYVRRILQNWVTDELYTLEQIEERQTHNRKTKASDPGDDSPGLNSALRSARRRLREAQREEVTA